LRGGDQAIVPGKWRESGILKRILADDPSERMPPAHTNKRITAEQIELLKRWIEDGAQWSEHWAYVTPKRPVLPQVSNPQWARNGIDSFILARLDKEKLQPSPEADRVTLIRRVTLDLTGLPPTPREVDAFLADPSPRAYERWLIACWPRPILESAWRWTGSTPPASPIRTATTSTPAVT